MSLSQRAFEASVKRTRGLAHPGVPVDGAEGWRLKCQRVECGREFLTPTKQRRYCSDECRNLEEARRARRQAHLERRAFGVCAAEACSERFARQNSKHRFCSTRCRKRAWRDASDLSPRCCEHCGQPFSSKRTRRARFCSPLCRTRHSRATAAPGVLVDSHPFTAEVIHPQRPRNERGKS